MQLTSIFQLFAKWLLVTMLLGSGWAMAQPEPNMAQIYATAQSGKLDDAQVMIQQVLLAHPKSAKAYFVQSELYARQGKLDAARAALASADKLAPGLAFAKPDAVQALRGQLSVNPVVGTVQHAPQRNAGPKTASSSWAVPLLLTAGVMVAAYFFFRRRTPEPYAAQSAYDNPNTLNGPQTFGMGGGGMQPAYPQTGYPQPGYPQQTGSGLGGRIMGGVATGLAVGAGVVAVEAIGRSLMGGHSNASSSVQNQLDNNNYQPLPSNTDMGGGNFGINDASSWDDGGSADVGGGSSEWDN